MSYRSMWSGAISFGIVTVAVEAVKATDGYAGDEALKQLCGCTDEKGNLIGEPFRRTEVCAHGRRRLTEPMEKVGDIENTTPVVKGLATVDGYVPVDQARVREITEALMSPVLEPLAYVKYDDAPMEWVCDTYMLRPSKKVSGASEPFQRLAEALDQEEKVLMAKWCPRGRQHLVAIHAVRIGEKPNEVLVYMNRVRYQQEQRDPDEQVLAATEVKPLPEAVQMMGELLTKLVPDTLEPQQDESVVMRQEVIEAALAGKPVKALVTTEPEPTPAVDLMGDLKRALAAAGGEAKPKAKPARKAPAKAKAKPKAKATKRKVKA
jgi:DNA end-binding protein Ku